MKSIEVRKLIIAAQERGMKEKEIMENYQIKKSTYYDLLKLYKETGVYDNLKTGPKQQRI